MHVTAGACMQRWLEDTDLDKIMQNYDANNDGKHLLRSTAAVEERTNTRESILGSSTADWTAVLNVTSKLS